jgi:signal transduction histidine kinase/ligand-binding sensor domain-containing protein
VERQNLPVGTPMTRAFEQIRRATTFAALGLLLAWCRCALALDPSLDVSQYAHTAWKVHEGISRGTIRSIAQTPDGYLWLGTQFGLVRFDGVRFAPWQPPFGEQLPSASIHSLLVARDGGLWIATDSGVASLKSGQLHDYPELAGTYFSLFEDHEGTIWAGGSTAPAKLCAIHRGVVDCHGQDGRFGEYVFAYEDNAGRLWVGAATGLWRWKPEPAQRYFVGDRISALIEGDDGAILCGVLSGMKQLVDSRAVDYQPAGMNQEFRVSTLLRDHDGGLWIGTTDRGLWHVHDGRTDQFSHSDGLSSDYVIKLIEDKEGNIWVAGLGGLDRFRNFAASTTSLKQGLSNAFALSVLASNQGIWVATANGLDKWVDGRISVYRGPGTPLGSGDEAAMAHQITVNAFHDNLFMALHQDEGGRVWVSTRHGVGYMDHGRFSQVRSVPPGPNVWAIAGTGAGNIWISQDNGLYHLLNGSTVEKFSWAALQRQDYAIALLPDPLRGGLWLGFARNGVAYLKDGRIQASYTEAESLGNGVVEQLRLGPDGAVWAATAGGLSRISDGHIATLTSKNGLPCDTVHWSVEDEDHSVWLYMPCGLVRIDRAEFDSWVAHPDRTVQRTVLDGTDGVATVGLASANRVVGFPTLGARTGQYSPLVAKSADGRLWFLPGEGVSVINPRHLAVNKLPPPVHIEQVTADRKTYDALPRLHLPALIRDLEIDYTALSLVAPEKNLFRYKLEGSDRDWHDVGNRRQAFYNDLPPGNYRFRVVASNNSGVWNEQGEALDFSIAPAYWQTNWFRAACGAAFFLVLWALYQLRLRQIAQVFNARLELLSAQAAMSLEHARLNTALSEAQQISHTGSWRWKVGTGEVSWSAEHFRIFGFDPATTQPSYASFLERVHAEDRPSFEQAFQRAVRERSRFQHEYRIVLPDRSVKHLQSVGQPEVTESGDLEFVGTVVDITERRSAEEALRSTQAELARVARLATMGELAASLSHEINQPLSAIAFSGDACLRWLNRDEPNLDEARVALSHMMRDAQRASGVIRGLRALAQKSGPRAAKVDINDAIQEVLLLTRGQLERYGVELRTELSGDDRPVFADRVQLQQVLLNLIINAVESMSTVTDRPKILTMISEPIEPGGLLVVVEDSGAGLDPAIADRIFDSFFTTKPEGMGVGLSICRSIINAHGGSISVSPGVPYGTVFRFTVPGIPPV